MCAYTVAAHTHRLKADGDTVVIIVRSQKKYRLFTVITVRTQPDDRIF